MMRKRDVLHLIVGTEITPTTKTGCGPLLHDCGSGVTYQFRNAVTCTACQETANRTAAMRGEEPISYESAPIQP